MKSRPGPKPRVTDDELLLLIRLYLKSSPFAGEGHRKAYAYLKRVKGICTSRTRVLRLMRENRLLSPNRRPCGEVNPPRRHHHHRRAQPPLGYRRLPRGDD